MKCVYLFHCKERGPHYISRASAIALLGPEKFDQGELCFLINGTARINVIRHQPFQALGSISFCQTNSKEARGVKLEAVSVESGGITLTLQPEARGKRWKWRAFTRYQGKLHCVYCCMTAPGERPPAEKELEAREKLLAKIPNVQVLLETPTKSLNFDDIDQAVKYARKRHRTCAIYLLQGLGNRRLLIERHNGKEIDHRLAHPEIPLDSD